MGNPHDLEGNLKTNLVQQAHGLRRIARELVRDPHTREDFVQETMYRAVRSHRNADLEPGPLGGWLRRTLVNFTRERHRTERRRRTREDFAAVRESEPSAAETTSRRETLRAVTDAVLALDEPYQTTVFLRYFEDLPPRAIAKRTGASVATIKSRLRRGLAMLRARLDRQSGGDRRQWRLALLGTFGLPTGAAAAGISLTLGTLIMGTATKTLVAAGVLGAIGLYFYGFGKDPTPIEPNAVAIVPTGPAAATAGKSLERETPTTVREAAATADAAPSWLDHPYTLELDVLIVDPLGLPVSARTLHLAPLGCSLNKATAKTGSDGRARVSWPSRQPRGDIVFADERNTLRTVRLQHGKPTSLTLVDPAKSAQTFQVFSGSRKTQHTVRFVSLDAGNFTLSNATGTPTMSVGLHPHALFANSPGPGAKPHDRTQLEVAWGGFAGSIGIEYLPEGPEPVTNAMIAGTVFGEDGKPAANVHVALMKNELPALHSKTDEHGRFLFKDLAADEFSVRAGGDAEGLASCAAVTTKGTTPVTLNLVRGSIVRGIAKAADGRPLQKASVTWRASDDSWCDSTMTSDNGEFTFANLPGPTGTVMLWDPSGKSRLPIAFAANVLPDTVDLLLQVQDVTGALRITPIQDEALSGFATIRVWSEDLGIATDVPTPKDGEVWILEALPAGWYRVELFHPAAGTFAAGRHWVDGKETCDLGRVILPDPAKAHVTLATGKASAERPVELYRIREDVDTRIEIAPSVAGEDPLEHLLLEGGDYAVFWKRTDGSVEHVRFSAEPGKDVTVRVPF